jgi:predicted CXXCH cytochrome family protein
MTKKKQIKQSKPASRAHKITRPASLGRFPLWAPAAALAAVVLLAGFMFVGMMKLEETDTFCGSCHTQPETLYLERMSKAVETAAAVDSASSHQSRRGEAANVHCIDCHAGPGLGGRAAAILEGAGNAVRYVTRTMVQPGKLRGSMPDANCLKCHADVIASENFKGKNNHFHYFLARWRAATPETAAACVECHLGHNDTGDPSLQFLVKDKAEVVCTRCHNTLGRD